MHTFTRTPADEGRDDGPLEYMRTYDREVRQEGFDRGLDLGLDKGLQKGLERGAIHGRRSILTRLLSRRFSLTEDERRRIASCEDTDALDAALDEIIIADTKEAVLAKLG